MKKNGFTLVELLAVIVILAIILVIALPVVVNRISQSKDDLYDRQLQLIIKAAEDYKLLYEKDIVWVGNYAEIYLKDLQDAGLLSDPLEDPRGGNFDNSKPGGYKVLITAIGGDESTYQVILPGSDDNFPSKLVYGGSSYDIFKNIIRITDGYVVVGQSYSTDGDLTGLNKGYGDAIIVKYDTLGNIVWKKNYGGSNDEIFYGVIEVSDGYVVVGTSNSNDGDLTGLYIGGYDAIIAKYDTSGNIVWKKNYGGYYGNDYFYGITQTTDGYVVVGESNSVDGDLTGIAKGSKDAIIVKYNTSGNIVWKRNFGGTYDETFWNIAKTTDGYIAVGNSGSTDLNLTGLNKGSIDAIIVKYDELGNIKWNKNYGGSSVEYFYGIIKVIDGYVAVGSSQSTNGDLTGVNKGSTDAIIVKYDLSGNVVWKKNYGGTNIDIFNNISQMADGIIAVGKSNSTDVDLIGLNKGVYDAIAVKYDSSGNILWKKNYGGNNNDNFQGIVGKITVGDSYSIDGDLAGLNKGYTDAIIFSTE